MDSKRHGNKLHRDSVTERAVRDLRRTAKKEEIRAMAATDPTLILEHKTQAAKCLAFAERMNKIGAVEYAEMMTDKNKENAGRLVVCQK